MWYTPIHIHMQQHKYKAFQRMVIWIMSCLTQNAIEFFPPIPYFSSNLISQPGLPITGHIFSPELPLAKNDYN